MTDLQLIQNLEEHAGFTLHRLGCDGNIYAKAVNLDTINRARAELCMAFAGLRSALTNIAREDLSRVGIMKSMDNFNIEDWND